MSTEEVELLRWDWFRRANSEFLSDGVINELQRITDGTTRYARQQQYVGGNGITMVCGIFCAG